MRSFGTAFIGFGITASIAVNSYQIKSAYAWGKLGHYTIATIASHYLNDNAKKKISEIQRPGETLANISDWADRVRYVEAFNYTHTFHYTNLEEGESFQTASINKDGDVVQALIFYEDQLRDPKTSPANKRMALNFFVHFVGDIHQPLHIGWGHDKGGNEVQLKVNWNKKETGQNSGGPIRKKLTRAEKDLENVLQAKRAVNLHSVIDSVLIKSFAGKRWKLDYDQCPESYAQYIEGNFPQVAFENAEAETYLDWVREGQELLPDIYSIGDGTLGVTYYERQLSMVNSQMAKAGYRLAMYLNRIFNRNPLSEAEIGMRTLVKTLCNNKCVLN